jgi:hypothetical protein
VNDKEVISMEKKNSTNKSTREYEDLVPLEREREESLHKQKAKRVAKKEKTE